jgi:succinate dehydrogenase / fumarate reductase, cytochrome b subunit
MATISGLRTTLVESVRYRGNIGHWSWVAHRLSGLAILGFLTIHVWDTANAAFRPDIYSWSIDLFKHPFFGAGEVAILGAVLYHAFNGIRITLLDFKPEWWHYQERSAYIVWGLFLILFVPMAIYLLSGIVTHCGELSQVGQSCWTIPDINTYLGNPAYMHESIVR